MGKRMTAAQVAAYGRDLGLRERSPGTVEKYLRDIGAFSRWLGGGMVSAETAARWKAHLVEAGYAPATVNSMLAAVNGLFRFLGWEDCRTRALRVQRRMFREPGRELTRADYERLLRAARERGLQRLELLMETLCATGIRVSELGYITVEAAKRRRAEISLKGKVRVILLPGKLSRKLLSYAARQKTASGAIFRTGSGRQLGRRQVWAELKAVRSMPLIVSSIMSKTLAAGADVIVLDVKCGGGAFMKTEAEARELAREMVEIGKLNGRRTVACITDMDQPLGNAVGNALEVAEALALLRGEYGGDLLELCLTLGSCILTEAGAASGEAEAREKLLDSIKSGAALEKFADFVRSQGGDAREVYEPSLLPQAPVRLEVPAPSSGYVNHIDAMGVGLVSMHLGGGRATKESEIDLSVGLVLHKKLADAVEAGESLATIHARDEESARRAVQQLAAAYEIGPERPERPPFVRDIIR